MHFFSTGGLVDMDLKQKFYKHVCQTSPFANGLEVGNAAGCWIADTSGRRYLDFIAGIGVANVGHCRPQVVAAVRNQVELYAHTMVYGEHIQAPQVEFATRLAELAPVGLDTVYFVSTGSEANDTALKAAAKLTGRSGIIAFKRAYHGDTVGALACFGDDGFRADYQKLLHPVGFLPFGREEGLRHINEHTAAVTVEPVQGEAGIIPPPKGFLQALRARATEVGAMLIFDEVQTGFGRTGEWFAAHTYGVTPDLITLAKAMGGGMPLGGVLGRHKEMNRFASEPPFSHITTFGGHPVSCAAGLAALELMREERLIENCRAQGNYLLIRLRDMVAHTSRIADVRGVGLMIGVELRSEQAARQVVTYAKDHGVIFETTLLNERVVRFSPPLIVDRDECDIALGVFEEALRAGTAA